MDQVVAQALTLYSKISGVRRASVGGLKRAASVVAPLAALTAGEGATTPAGSPS
jgi:hypothetical protein